VIVNKFNIPEKSLKYLIICSGIIALFILAGIIPLNRYNHTINGDMKKLLDKIEEQKSLKTVYSTLINSIEKKNLRILPNPAKTALSRQEASKFQDVFREVATKSGLTTVSLAPELSTLAGSSKYLLYNATVKGEFVNFRKMLMALGNVSFLDRIDEIRIQQYPDSMEFRIKIWIELGN
jgi:hypothetical protein